jgi:hypothetical protein
MVGVAQLVERQVVVLDAAGSSPVTHPSVLAGQRPRLRIERGRSSFGVRFWGRNGGDLAPAA